MKTIYILKHIYKDTEIVGTFTDIKKAEQAFNLFAEDVQSRYPVTNVQLEQSVEIRQKWYCNLRNGHIVKREESKLFTHIEQFTKMVIDNK